MLSGYTYIMIPIDPVRWGARLDLTIKVGISSFVNGICGDRLSKYKFDVGCIWKWREQVMNLEMDYVNIQMRKVIDAVVHTGHRY